jgi:hypothetical protein
VIQLQDLLPLTFPSCLASRRRMGPFLSPKGRGKVVAITACKDDQALQPGALDFEARFSRRLLRSLQFYRDILNKKIRPAEAGRTAKFQV